MGCLYVSLAQWFSTLAAPKKTDWLCLALPPSVVAWFCLFLSLGLPGNNTEAAKLENLYPKFDEKNMLSWYYGEFLPESSVPALAVIRSRMSL